MKNGTSVNDFANDVAREATVIVIVKDVTTFVYTFIPGAPETLRDKKMHGPRIFSTCRRSDASGIDRKCW